MDNTQDLAQLIQESMTKYLEASPLHDLCKTASAAVGLDKVVVFEVLIVAAILFLVLIFGMDLIVKMTCFVYPCIASVKSLEYGPPGDRVHWTSYWITFFTFQTIESLMPRLFSSIPFYFWFKVAFLVWCYHPVTKGASKVYDVAEPLREVLLPLLDPLLDGIFPPSSKPTETKAMAEKVSKENEYIPTGITVHLESLKLHKSDSLLQEPKELDSGPSVPNKSLYVEIFLAKSGESGQQPICVGAKYKTPPLTGNLYNFQYNLTLIPPTDILNESGATLCFVVKERLTFGDDPVIFESNTPVDVSSLQSPGKVRSSSPENDGELVSVSVGRRSILLQNEIGTINGWIELVSER